MWTGCLTIFASVFRAEFGDKTQIAAALFASEGDRPKWLVFLASSAALVSATAYATRAGLLHNGLFNGPGRNLTAGAVFILISAFIGAFIVLGALRPA